MIERLVVEEKLIEEAFSTSPYELFF